MTEAASPAEEMPLIIGRYALFDALASGGMATVHLGRLLGAVGFGRTVAVKRLHAHYTSDPEFVTMFMDEARIVARIRHPNVVPMVDAIESRQGLFLVMEYVHGESFSRLLRTCRASGEAIPLKLVATILHGVLLGLHAAHETKSESGELLDVVHRDVSPQNVIVGADGVARVLDFGVAKAAGRAQVTREGQIKGKLAYMAPEQIRGRVDRRADVFAASIMLWESLAGRRFHEGAKDVEIVTRVVEGSFPPPSAFRPDVPPELDAVVMKGLAVDPIARWPSAREMAVELERTIGLAPPSEVGEWVERLATDALRGRAAKVSAMEKAAGDLLPAESNPPPPPPPDGEDSGSRPGRGNPANGADPRRSGEFTELMARPGDPSSDGAVPLATSPSSISESRSGTPLGTELPAHVRPTPPRDLAPLVAVVTFCIALGLIGLVLAAWSLHARRSVPQSGSVPTATTRSPLGPSSTTSAPSASDPVAAPSTSTAPAPSASASANPRRPTGATNVPPRNGGATPTVTPPVTPATSTANAKKNCDPPFTVDEAGHRKYKLECMPD